MYAKFSSSPHLPLRLPLPPALASMAIHVLDDAALVLLLRMLDTAADLIAYLEKKERLILSRGLGFAAGEEALLGCI
jgi:hypothetical protein